MPNSYLDRLHRQAEEITQGIDTLVNRAAEENRDVSDEEQAQVDRDQARLTELQTSIQHYTDLETRQGAIAEMRQRVRPAPQLTRSGPENQGEPEYQLSDDFPDAGTYAVTLHRAMVLRDPAAREAIDRATAHQLLADNPGIVPRPVVGSLVNLINSSRPFISSIGTKPLPAGSFDRPTITQHVAVGVQAAEKTLTDSQKLTIGKLPVQAKTFAGHLNISRQDVKWTSPGIMQIVYEDFAAIYAVTTDNDAADSFAGSVTSAAIPVESADYAGVAGALYQGAQAGLAAGSGAHDTLWLSPDVWGALGGATEAQGNPSFPGLSLGSSGGSVMGLRVVVDHNFPAGTMISGPSRFAEWYEDVDGLMQVGEPDVLGQLVGYAGYGAFLNVAPTAFSKYAAPPVGP